MLPFVSLLERRVMARKRSKTVPKETPFTKKVNQLLKSAGITRFALGREARISQPYLWAVMNGLKVPSNRLIEKISRTLGPWYRHELYFAAGKLMPEVEKFLLGSKFTYDLLRYMEKLPKRKVKSLLEKIDGEHRFIAKINNYRSHNQ
jgi:transcriptional regulator with XRE-family HTH domain